MFLQIKIKIKSRNIWYVIHYLAAEKFDATYLKLVNLNDTFILNEHYVLMQNTTPL
ncbi:hypothetical protein NTGHW29_420046 [Candidatus Nitrotoga sp. HW29]|nr:hypothetical protein NTGHW29_420046 [Candidatus Nitrotoga sp. HW29]